MPKQKTIQVNNKTKNTTVVVTAKNNRNAVAASLVNYRNKFFTESKEREESTRDYLLDYEIEKTTDIDHWLDKYGD